MSDLRAGFEKWSDSVGLFRGLMYDDTAWEAWQAAVKWSRQEPPNHVAQNVAAQGQKAEALEPDNVPSSVAATPEAAGWRRDAMRYRALRPYMPRVEIRYWNGRWWEAMNADNLDAFADGLCDTALSDLAAAPEVQNVAACPHPYRPKEAAAELPPLPEYIEQRLLTWRQRFVNKSGDQLALDDFMDKESLADLIDFVCDEYALAALKGA